MDIIVYEPGVGETTPWGDAAICYVYGDTVRFYDTLTGGGFKVDAEENLRIHPAWRNADGWYEETVEAAIVVYTFCERFDEVEPGMMEPILSYHYPNAWRMITTTSDKPEDEEEPYITEALLNVDDEWIPAGMLEVEAVRADGRDRRRFLVSKSEYEQAGGKLTIDLQRHKIVGPTLH
jgi:hypothetical protein